MTQAVVLGIHVQGESLEEGVAHDYVKAMQVCLLSKQRCRLGSEQLPLTPNEYSQLEERSSLPAIHGLSIGQREMDGECCLPEALIRK